MATLTKHAFPKRPEMNLPTCDCFSELCWCSELSHEFERKVLKIAQSTRLASSTMQGRFAMQRIGPLLGLLVLSITLAERVPAQANVPLIQHNVSLDMALGLAQGARASCKRDGFDVTVVIIDRAGQLVVVLKSDIAGLHNVELARRKAYTARTFRRTSLEWAQLLIAHPELVGQKSLPNVIALGGGVPIVLGEEPIGAIGVSGTTSQEADESCAKAAIAGIGKSMYVP
jgi:uncharacterized protein GlcG (DUF336 family)